MCVYVYFSDRNYRNKYRVYKDKYMKLEICITIEFRQWKMALNQAPCVCRTSPAKVGYLKNIILKFVQDKLLVLKQLCSHLVEIPASTVNKLYISLVTYIMTV